MAKKKTKPLITWRGIQHAINTFVEGYRFQAGAGDSSLWYMDWTKFGPLCQLVPFVHINDTELCLRRVYIDGKWDFHSLSTMIPPEVCDYLRQIHAPCKTRHEASG